MPCCPGRKSPTCLSCCTSALMCLSGHCVRVPAREATKQELLRVHTSDHLQRLQMFCSGTIPATNVPSDTYINQHTLHCAALAARQCCGGGSAGGAGAVSLWSSHYQAARSPCREQHCHGVSAFQTIQQWQQEPLKQQGLRGCLSSTGTSTMAMGPSTYSRRTRLCSTCRCIAMTGQSGFWHTEGFLAVAAAVAALQCFVGWLHQARSMPRRVLLPAAFEPIYVTADS